MKVRVIEIGYWQKLVVPEDRLGFVMDSLSVCFNEDGTAISFTVKDSIELQDLVQDTYKAKLKRAEEDLQREKDHAAV